MQNNFEKIKNLIAESNLELSDQIMLTELFSKTEDNKLEEVVELFSSNPSWIEKINENYKAKHEAMTTGDSELWKKIVEEEEKQLENVKE